MKKYTALILLLFSLVSFAQERIITHTNYTISFNERCKQANWVSYTLTSEETQRKFKRTNKFRPDPKIDVFTNYKDSYLRSGFDRGHLAPAGDMGFTREAVVESFYYTNMSPQRPRFNRGVWRELEARVRQWAIECDSVLVVTGPVIKEGLVTIGRDSIVVPELFFKIIIDASSLEKSVAFLIPNERQTKNLQRFVVPIDCIEFVTGFDFFPNLRNEDVLENKLFIENWDWKKFKILWKKDI